MQARAEDTRRAIERAALATFCERGYRAATLEDVGERVGITRGTVLHHFRSKAGLLFAVVDPYLRDVADLLARSRVDDPPTASQRRRVLTEFADLFIAHRGPARLLATDVSARVQLDLVERWDTPSSRALTLLIGNRASEMGRVRVAAALGAMVQPLLSAQLELDSGDARDELVDAALAVLDRPGAVVLPAPAGPLAEAASR
jgi:TetR/AcrR family transcriptional repressor of bet genes